MIKKTIFNELDFYDTLTEIDKNFFYNQLIENELDDLFNNEYANKKYIITGSIGLWDGIRQGYSPKIANSIKEAIYNATDGFGMCYITVAEEKYGKLIIDISHHDGNNHLEIREVTNLGEQLLNQNYNNVDAIINRKGATRNVKFFKRYF